MAAPRRVARLQKLIHEIAAETLQRRLKDPRLGFVTVTRVKLSPDLHEATIFWSFLGTEPQRRSSARALADAASWVQGLVGKALRTRVTPRLTFAYDPTLAKAERLEGLFEQLRRERGEDAPESAGEPPEPEGDEGAPGDGEGPGGTEGR